MMDAAKVQLEKKLLKMEGELKVANLEKENAKLEKDKADMRAEMLEMKARLQMIEMQKQIDDLKAADNGKADGGAGGQSSTKQPSLIAKKETTVDNNVLITIEEEDVVELKVALPKVKQEVRQVEISEAVSGPEKKAQLQLDKPSSSYGTLAEKFVVALGKENQPAKLGQSPTLLALGGGQQAKDQRNVMKARDTNKSHGGTGAGHSKSKLNIKGPKRHSCEKCHKSFAYPGQLKSHKCRQGVNPRECKVCNKIFSRPEYIRIHMRQHTGEKPYGCEICGKPYTNLAPLKRHQSKKACKPADEDEVRQGRGMMDVSVGGGQNSGGIGNGGHQEP